MSEPGPYDQQPTDAGHPPSGGGAWGPGPGPGWGAPGQQPPAHPSATTVLVLGIVGITVCGLAAPFAWTTGNRVLREIDAQPMHWSGRDTANVGRILGIVGSVVLGLGLLVLVLMLVFFGIAVTGVLSMSP